MKIVFFGTPPCAIPALQALVNEGFDVVGVITQPNKPAGRGLKLEQSPIKVKALELGLNVLEENVVRGFIPRQAAYEVPRYIDKLSDLKPDFGVVVAYGKIIPPAVLDIFPCGVLNIHPSLLPKYRGPSPVQSAILNGDKQTGVTIMLLDCKMDHGPILAQRIVAIPPLKLRGGQGELCTGGQLTAKLFQIGTDLLLETLPKYLAGKLASQAQDHTQATFSKLLTRADGQINWNQPAEYIDRIIRAYNPWPGAWTTWNNKRLKILSAQVCESRDSQTSTPGYVWQTKNGQLAVHCNPGIIILEQLQLEGKKPMTKTEFLQGHIKILQSILGS